AAGRRPAGRDPGAGLLSAVRAAALGADGEGRGSPGADPAGPDRVRWAQRRPEGGADAMSSLIIAAAQFKGPHIDWASFMPIVILGVGALVVLLIGLLGPVARTAVVPVVTIRVLVAS